jgi:hypothetical protein
MSDPEQKWLTTCQKFFVSKKIRGVPYITPRGSRLKNQNRAEIRSTLTSAAIPSGLGSITFAPTAVAF